MKGFAHKAPTLSIDHSLVLTIIAERKYPISELSAKPSFVAR